MSTIIYFIYKHTRNYLFDSLPFSQLLLRQLSLCAHANWTFNETRVSLESKSRTEKRCSCRNLSSLKSKLKNNRSSESEDKVISSERFVFHSTSSCCGKAIEIKLKKNAIILSSFGQLPNWVKCASAYQLARLSATVTNQWITALFMPCTSN